MTKGVKMKVKELDEIDKLVSSRFKIWLSNNKNLLVGFMGLFLCYVFLILPMLLAGLLKDYKIFLFYFLLPFGWAQCFFLSFREFAEGLIMLEIRLNNRDIQKFIGEK